MNLATFPNLMCQHVYIREPCKNKIGIKKTIYILHSTYNADE